MSSKEKSTHSICGFISFVLIIITILISLKGSVMLSPIVITGYLLSSLLCIASFFEPNTKKLFAILSAILDIGIFIYFSFLLWALSRYGFPIW